MSQIHQTLIEQMHISDAEIRRRMELLEFSSREIATLVSQLPLIEEHVDEIVDAFYEQQVQVTDIARLIGDADTLARLHDVQREYVLALFSGNYDAEYVNNRLRIGLVHKRIGVEPKLYLSAIRTLKYTILGAIRTYSSSPGVIGEIEQALDMLFYFDITLVFDTYIDSLLSELRTEKERTEEYAQGLEEKVAERTRELNLQARLDPLTGIYNQRAMRELFARELAVARRQGNHITVAYFDVDEFKGINDRFGHLRGDEVLKHLGQVLKDSVREVDIPCRHGGDEFCLLLPNCGADDATQICSKIVERFHARFPDFHLSIGLGESDVNTQQTLDELMQLADANMYRAKQEKGSVIRSGSETDT